MATSNILMVDDERQLCDSLACLLRAKNYAVETANNGSEAIALLSRNTFDLAILDLHLPDMLGVDIISEIKSQSKDTEVVIITGEADIESALASLKNGAYDYLRKPFEFEELLNTAEHAIEQKLLKQEKNRITEQLTLSEKKYRYLVHNSPDIIYTLDADGNFSFVSEAVEYLLGFKAAGLIGKHYSTIIYEADRGKAKQYFSERRSKVRASAGIELRLKVNQPADNYRSPQTLAVELKWMGLHKGDFTNGRAEYIGTHGVIRDISERSKLQAQLQKAERMESLGTLAGGIAHDFNNLLMGVQGRSTLISMDLHNPNSIIEHINAIDDYIHSATELTRQLLGFARGGKYEVKPTNIIELIHKSSNMFGRTKKEITIDTKFHSENVVVEIDRGQIEQVFLNLYVNAWQAMPEGGMLNIETDEITIRKKERDSFQLEPGRYVRISVKDNGIGMSQKIIKRIFDPFFTTKDKGRGTGLGLASAYGIIENHGGSINVTSEMGIGTTFSIYLPVSKAIMPKEVQQASSINNGSETILLVDDEEMIIDVGKSLLLNLGYHVIAVNNGEEAINVIRYKGGQIDLILLDMIMPVMDGDKTFDQIRKIRPDIPVMLCSGYAINSRAEKIMRKGCNGFIQKPFTLSELSQKIRQILDYENMTRNFENIG